MFMGCLARYMGICIDILKVEFLSQIPELHRQVASKYTYHQRNNIISYHIIYKSTSNHRRPSSIVKTSSYTIYLLGSGLSKLKSNSPKPSLVVLIPIVFLPLPGTGIVGGPSLASSGPPVGGRKVNPPNPTDA